MDKTKLIGKTFGRLTVVGFSHADRFYRSVWRCACVCGEEAVILGSSLTRGMSRSCGCLFSSPRPNKRFTHKIIDGEERKRCYKCEEWLKLSDYFRSAENWDGLQKKCKTCERSRNHKKYKETHRNYVRERRASDTNFKILLNLRVRIASALRGAGKSRKTMELLGCPVDYLKSHLEGMFTEEMNWENYGTYWHVDHVRPCASFDLSDVEQQKICFHYTNLQPLEAIENMTKRDRMPCE